MEKSGTVMPREKFIERIYMSLVVVFFCLLCVLLVCFGSWKVEKEITCEAGSGLPELSDFLLRDFKNAEFVTDLEEAVNMNQIGDYEIVIRVSKREYTSVLHVVDTVAPKVETRKKQIYVNDPVDPADFIKRISDATDTTVEYLDEPNLTEPGMHFVMLTVTDAGGNSTEASAEVNVIEDKVAPVIAGVEEIFVTAGSSVSYKRGIVVTDNHDENVKLTVDSSAVNLNKPDDYTVNYIAEDSAGNKTEASTIVHVEEPGEKTATEDYVNMKADEILAGIISENMSQYEIAQAIFNWVHQGVAYLDGSDKENWVQGAYCGLVNRRGDCYVYAATSKCLLTRAGITNMDIGFVNPRRTHYWNLIDIGEGWYHFDTTRRSDGRSFFYVKDAEITAYSQSHGGSHAYDPSQYPKIQ